MSSDLHNYIHSVLETGDHGPYRVIKFKISDLNEVLEHHSKKIGENPFCSVRVQDTHDLTFFSPPYSWERT